ncbi:MAG: hypothetical protein ABSC06_38520, partial [Rhodopila sp.]
TAHSLPASAHPVLRCRFFAVIEHRERLLTIGTLDDPCTHAHQYGYQDAAHEVIVFCNQNGFVT